jgi:hypothetical protein
LEISTTLMGCPGAHLEPMTGIMLKMSNESLAV